MAKRYRARDEVPEEMDELKSRLHETEETLNAIRQYLVDAFVVDNANGAQVLTLTGADFPYRRMVETMNEGAVTLIPDGTIFYCNPRFCEMLATESEQLVGYHFKDLVLPTEQEAFETIFKEAGQDTRRGMFNLRIASGKYIPAQLSLFKLQEDKLYGISIIVTDITERIQAEEKIRSLASKLTKAEQIERHRISQILHDDLQQYLFAIKAQLTTLQFDYEDQASAEIWEALDEIQGKLSEAINMTRNLSIDISPSVLHDEGLLEAISWLSTKMYKDYGLQVEIESPENFNRLTEDMRVLLFRASRELLFNIVKHSGTLQAKVQLERLNDHVRITISDNGKGFDVRAVMDGRQHANGLLTLQDRLAMIDGTLRLESRPGKGTQVVIEAPLDGY